MSAAKVFDFASAFEILKGEHDPLREIWDNKAGRHDRRLLLAMAGAARLDAQWMIKKQWCELSGEVRANVATGLKRFKGWAAKVGA